MVHRRILIAVLLAALFAVGWWGGRGGSSGDLYGNLDLFVEVLHRVEDNYVDAVEPEQLVKGAIDGMLATLDPHSQYLDAYGYDNLKDVTQGSFNGIGVEVSIRDHFPTVISPLEGGPAWEAGVQSGDVIVRVDDHSTANYTLEETSKALRGASGTKVTIAVAREGEAERDLVLTRREVVLASVPYSFVLPDGIGYVRLARFSQDSGAELRRALARLHAGGAKSLVLDLRRNPGGLLDQAVDVAEQFVPHGAEIVSTRGRARVQDRRYFAADAQPETRWPMVVLVDEGSASASEIVAGALQDLDRALVLGRTSFGKGSVQNVFTLHGGRSAVKLTTAYYYTPSGRSIHKQGHEPNAATADDEDDEDATPEDSIHAGLERPSAAADTLPRPAYRTRSGRTVYGGGGITPDVFVVADTLGPVAQEVERRGLALRFARRWQAAHPRDASDATLREAWSAFTSFALAESVASADSLAVEREPIERILRREIARRTGGDALAARTVLEDDPAMQRAVAILQRARTAKEVFALAKLPPARSLAAPREDVSPRRPAANSSGRRGAARRS